MLIRVGLFTRIAAFIASGDMAFAYFYGHVADLEGRHVGELLADRATAASWP